MFLQQESKKHHYVPQFLLDKWAVSTNNNKVMHAYYWNSYKSKICCKADKGSKYYCQQEYLLSLEKESLQDRDILEKDFFSEIDNKAAVIYDSIIKCRSSVNNLTEYQKSDFAKFLMSLDVRRPSTILKIRNESINVKTELNYDTEILAALKAEGLQRSSPSNYYENTMGNSIADKTLLKCAISLTNNPNVIDALVNYEWYVMHLNKDAESFILSDRPLIRFNPFDSLGAVWIVPLTPDIVFFAVNHSKNAKHLLTASHSQLSKKLNISSVIQAEKYVFSTNGSHKLWLGKYMSNKHNY